MTRNSRNGAATPSVEYSLRAVAQLAADGVPIHKGALTAYLGMSADMVSRMLRQLTRAGFITVAPYHGATLTLAGQEAARAMLHQHFLRVQPHAEEPGCASEETYAQTEHQDRAVSPLLKGSIAANGSVAPGQRPAR